MLDYGLRISQDGFDAKECDDLDCVVTSKYFNLKGVLSGVVELNNPSSGTVHTVLAHNLGYELIALVFTANTVNQSWYQQPYPLVQSYGMFSNYCDNTNLYIKIMLGAGTFTFRYYIFLDKGNLN